MGRRREPLHQSLVLPVAAAALSSPPPPVERRGAKAENLGQRESVRARGVATIYRDPYWFLPTRVGGGWQKLPEWRATTTDSAAA